MFELFLDDSELLLKTVMLCLSHLCLLKVCVVYFFQAKCS